MEFGDTVDIGTSSDQPGTPCIAAPPNDQDADGLRAELRNKCPGCCDVSNLSN